MAFITLNLFAQHTIPDKQIGKKGRKGELYFYWGWNWSGYTNSDIHFKGDNYDFTLKDVKAKDRQSEFSYENYFKPSNITLPQTNMRIGYFINDKYDISIGVDHMKYVMVQDQTVKINGHINETGTPYDGVYNNDDIILAKDFLVFEHTDGLNYINVELSRSDDVFEWLKIQSKHFELYLTEGVGVGALLPKTNATLLNNERHDDFHLAGYGLSAKVGLHLKFFKHFFIQSEGKGGFIHMPDIRTTPSTSDKASQHFFFLQGNILIGGAINLSKNK
ncbi:membrane protein [Aureibacter tunicatorum]|nr:membrane protein [Aureibacter tunicatorum]